ncbi:MAG: hypothetical protein E6H83_10520 [Chloroflexi bacterium]|nr:MAG: hypothetical protein E6H83_10520 [Chloroflexota bacterium]
MSSEPPGQVPPPPSGPPPGDQPPSGPPPTPPPAGPPPPPPIQPYQPAQRGYGVPLGIVAIVMGINARNRANAGQGAFGGSGKALAGIITGAVAVGVGAIAAVLALAFAGLSGSGILNNLITTPTPT